jgi:hypothetical protein
MGILQIGDLAFGGKVTMESSIKRYFDPHVSQIPPSTLLEDHRSMTNKWNALKISRNSPFSGRVLASFETIPPAHVDHDTSNTSYASSTSDQQYLCPSALVRDNLSHTKQGTKSCTNNAEIVHRLLTVVL